MLYRWGVGVLGSQNVVGVSGCCWGPLGVVGVSGCCWGVVVLGCVGLWGCRGVVGLNGIMALMYLVFLLPNLSVLARRLHDVNRSGWWMLISLTIIGLIPLFIWLVSETKQESNQWGQPAK